MSALVVTVAEPTAADILAALIDLEASLERLLESLIGATERVA